MITFKELIESFVPVVNNIDGWNIRHTHHGFDQANLRDAPDDHNFHSRVVKRLNSPIQKITKEGEYMFTSKALNRSAVMNVSPHDKEIRIITVLPHGHHKPKPGTKVHMIENVEPTEYDVD